jgi:hypothetical protein
MQQERRGQEFQVPIPNRVARATKQNLANICVFMTGSVFIGRMSGDILTQNQEAALRNDICSDGTSHLRRQRWVSGIETIPVISSAVRLDTLGSCNGQELLKLASP